MHQLTHWHILTASGRMHVWVTLLILTTVKRHRMEILLAFLSIHF